MLTFDVLCKHVFFVSEILNCRMAGKQQTMLSLSKYSKPTMYGEYSAPTMLPACSNYMCIVYILNDKFKIILLVKQGTVLMSKKTSKLGYHAINCLLLIRFIFSSLKLK